MIEEITKYIPKGILIDTNLLLVYSIGLFRPDMIGRHMRTKAYTAEDFERISKIVRMFRVITTTPHILAELFNLTVSRSEAKPPAFYDQMLDVLRSAKEVYIAKDELLPLRSTSRLGITDTGILEFSKRSGVLVFTDDFALTGYIQKAKCPVLNFTNLRGQSWL